jgi:hypothetical protein
VPPEDEPELLAAGRPFEPSDVPQQPPDPPSMLGACNGCGHRGIVYPGRYGGDPCSVCFGLQHG